MHVRKFILEIFLLAVILRNSGRKVFADAYEVFWGKGQLGFFCYQKIFQFVGDSKF